MSTTRVVDLQHRRSLLRPQYIQPTFRTKCVDTESGSWCVMPAALRAAEMAREVSMPPFGASPNDHLLCLWGGTISEWVCSGEYWIRFIHVSRAPRTCR